MNFKQKNIDLFFTLLNVSKYPLNIGICKQTHYQKWSWHFYTSTVLSYLCSKNDFFRDVIIYELRVTSWKFFMRVASYFLRVENKNYKLPIYFTSCELLFTSYDLRVENKNYELQVMVLFHLKKKFTEHSEDRKSLLPV